MKTDPPPMTVQLTPSAELYPVNRPPARSILSHLGPKPLATAVVLLPPAVLRYTRSVSTPGVVNTEKCGELFASDWRIMMPILALVTVFSSDATCATIDPSPP